MVRRPIGGYDCNTNSLPGYFSVVGVQSSIRFSTGAVPSWGAIRAAVAATGNPPVVRMIDGLPAFPDETPPDEWKEVRIGLAGTMVTLRRTEAGIDVVTWGTADPALESARSRVCDALSQLSEGNTG
jgi:hypothetical protein